MVGMGAAQADQATALAPRQAFAPGPQLVTLVAILASRALIQAQHGETQATRSQGCKMHLLKHGG